jgi:anti-anti-sigma factor
MKLHFNLEDDLILAQTEGQIVEVRHAAGLEPFAQLLGDKVYARKVLLDLSHTDFISSSGLGWLISCNKHFKAAGGTLIVHSSTPTVWQMIKIMRLDKVLRTAPDLDAARQLVEAHA